MTYNPKTGGFRMKIISLTIPSYKAFMYRQVWKITAWRDSYVWKSHPIGYIDAEESYQYSTDKYQLTSISTSLTANKECVLEPYISPAVSADTDQ